jgi:hypothetical protein
MVGMAFAAIRNTRLGILALCALILGFSVDFAINGRQDMYCFGPPPVHNWAYRCGQVAFFTMLISVVLAILGLRKDQPRGYSVIALVCFLPLLLIDALRAGCW